MSISEVVKRYGGQQSLADKLGIRQNAISYWVKNNRIPSKWHGKLLKIAQNEGVNILATDLLAVNTGFAQTKDVENTAPTVDMTLPESATGAEQFLFYASEKGPVKVQVLVSDETVWASQKGMAEIFEVSVPTISEHLQNIYQSNELEISTTIRNFRTVVDSEKEYNVKFHNLDAIISVGYRVNSYKATQFRRWATSILKEYLIKGFALDDDRLKQGNRLFDKDYFDELIERIREIRASERRFYQKVTDIYRECSIDYDLDSPITRQFYANVQDKLHFAVHGHTSAELVMLRANASKPNMGLTSFRHEKTGGKLTKSDVTVGKNYLSGDEIGELNRLVSMYLDWADGYARRRILMTMKDWAEKLDGFLSFNAYDVLDGYGKVRRDAAERHALSQYEKYRVIQDKNYISDFDKMAEGIKTKNRLPRKPSKTK